jgi:hypothetical protein
MASKRQQTMAKLTRERTVKERRERKQEKKRERKLAAAERAESGLDPSAAPEEADGAEEADSANGAEDSGPAVVVADTAS